MLLLFSQMKTMFLRCTPKRILILFGLPTSMDIELSNKHHELTDTGFYAIFRKRLDDFYSRIRIRIETDDLVDLLGDLTAEEITLAAVQRQALITIHKNTFKKAIAYYLLTGKRIWFPVSNEWQTELADLDLQFNNKVCHVLYFLTSLGYFLKSIFTSLSDFCLHRCGAECENSTVRSKVFFSGLTPANFPSIDNRNYNLVHWLSEFLIPPTNIYHDCIAQKNSLSLNQSTFIFCNKPFNSSNRSKNLKCWFIFINFLIRGTREKSVGFSQRLIVSKELLRALCWDFSAGLDSHVSVFFQSTVLVAKPLWAIAAEKSGVEVVLFHYAIGSEPTTGSNPIIQDGIWQLNTWKAAWVVDDQQIAEISLSTAYPPTKYRKVGVPFWGGSGNLKGITGLIPIVSLFDTNILADSKFSAGKLDELGWNDRGLELDFVRIVLQAAEGFQLTIAHKKKRSVLDDFSSYREQQTKELLNRYPENYLVIDESVSSDLLISKSAMVISKPVSTTAIAAKMMSIYSIFLDPTGRIHADDSSLRNLEIISTVEELRAIFAKHFRTI